MWRLKQRFRLKGEFGVVALPNSSFHVVSGIKCDLVCNTSVPAEFIFHHKLY